MSTPISNNSYGYAIIDCSEGDIFTITGLGAIAARLYSFIDSSSNIINVASVNSSFNNKIISAPKNSSKLIINVKLSNEYLIVKGYYLPTRLKDIADELEYDKLHCIYYNNINKISGYYIKNNTENPVELSGAYCTDFIPVYPYMQLQINNVYLVSSRAINEYDKDKKFIRTIATGQDSTITQYKFETSYNCRYIRYTIMTNGIIDLNIYRQNLILTGSIRMHNNFTNIIDADCLSLTAGADNNASFNTITLYDYLSQNTELLTEKQYKNILIIQPYNDFYNDTPYPLGYLNTKDSNYDTSTIYGSLQALYELIKENQPNAIIKFASTTYTIFRLPVYDAYINAYADVASFYNCSYFNLFNTLTIKDIDDFYQKTSSTLLYGISNPRMDSFIKIINNILNFGIGDAKLYDKAPKQIYDTNNAYLINLFTVGTYDIENNIISTSYEMINPDITHYITKKMTDEIYSIQLSKSSNYKAIIHYFLKSNSEYYCYSININTTDMVYICNDFYYIIEFYNENNQINPIHITQGINIKINGDYSNKITLNKFEDYIIGRYDASFNFIYTNTAIACKNYIPEYVNKIVVLNNNIKLVVIGRNKNNGVITRNYWMTYQRNTSLNPNKFFTYEFDHSNYIYKFYAFMSDEKFHEYYKIIDAINLIIDNSKYVYKPTNSNPLIDDNKEMIKRIMRANYDITYANATKPMILENPYGNIQNVHPKVVYDANGIFNHTYWMAYTPYDFSIVAHENPCIAYSDDGYNFTTIDASPIDDDIDVENSCYNSDTHLLYNYNTGILECYFRYLAKQASTGLSYDNEIIYRMTSSNGLTWGNKTIAYESGAGSICLSPAIVYDYTNNIYRIWSIRGYNSFNYYESIDGLNWDFKNTFTLTFTYRTITNLPWHVDVEYIDGKYIMLVMTKWRDTTNAVSNDNWILYQCESTDAINWSTPKAIILPIHGTIYQGIYRACMIKVSDSLYRIYYSHRNGGIHHISISESEDMNKWIGLF